MIRLALVLLLAGCNAQPVDFVCVMDGEEVTTYHTGLTTVTDRGDGAYFLRYVEGGERVYLQRRGEACGEEIP